LFCSIHSILYSILFYILFYYIFHSVHFLHSIFIPFCSLFCSILACVGINQRIGEATAVDLARRGARVILACRDKARGESAMYNIRRESGNSEVILMILDLASLNSVRAFAQSFLASEPRLDILINNAGGGTAFQVNHLAHFLLTHLLLDRLKRCAPSRIVILSSIAHISGKIDFQTIHKPGKGMQNALHSYSSSKLANILHARELAKRLEGTNVTCYAVHPGVVNTKITRSHPWWTLWLTSIHCATEEGIERLSGRYFVDCQPKVPSPLACDDQLATKLWELSERLSGKLDVKFASGSLNRYFNRLACQSLPSPPLPSPESPHGPFSMEISVEALGGGKRGLPEVWKGTYFWLPGGQSLGKAVFTLPEAHQKPETGNSGCFHPPSSRAANRLLGFLNPIPAQNHTKGKIDKQMDGWID
uniref:Dehydrogenase/reductase SDR family member 13 n=1 Tax=Laticauda laticaudata TaxID=8630 RepID=A0A8C5WS56_LATLA